MHCVYGGYNLHRFSDALGLVSKIFCLGKNGGHFEFSNFSQKLQNIKMLISRKAC